MWESLKVSLQEMVNVWTQTWWSVHACHIQPFDIDPHHVQVSARGPRPNTEFISTIGPDALTKNGFVRVQPTLQLIGHPNIFAGGDAIDWPEQKQSAKAKQHAGIIARNVVAYLGGKSLQEYKGSIEMIAITNGRVCGFDPWPRLALTDIYRTVALGTSMCCGASR